MFNTNVIEVFHNLILSGEGGDLPAPTEMDLATKVKDEFSKNIPFCHFGKPYPLSFISMHQKSPRVKVEVKNVVMGKNPEIGRTEKNVLPFSLFLP